jgi:hypothetical protein
MIRAWGIVAFFSSAALALILIARTHSAELRGPLLSIDRILPERQGQPVYGTPTSGTFRVLIITANGEPTSRESRDLNLGGFSLSSGWISDERGRRFLLGIDVPQSVAEAARSGDELIVRSKCFILPGMKDSPMIYMKYEVRRGGKSQFFGDPENQKFILIYCLIVGAPVLLWGIAAGIVALVEATMKEPRAAKA